MKCPLCELPLEQVVNDPDEATRAICCNCRISITIRQLPNDYVCEDDE